MVVTLRLASGRLEVLGPDLRCEWDSSDLRAEDAPRPLMRIGPVYAQARVELTDEAFAEALTTLCLDLHARAGSARGSLKLALAAMAVGGMLLGLATFGMPFVADILAPLVPASVEERIGATVQEQIGHLLGNPPVCAAPAGRAAIDQLVARLGTGVPPGRRVSVRRSSQANAFALPSARVVILSKLIDQAQTPDEFVGILAHELGHVSARDPLRSLIRDSGTAYLFSYLVGDLIGSAVFVTVGQAALTARYSREAEAAADAFAVAALVRVGGDGAALAAILERIAVDKDGELAFLRSHPFTRDRAAAIRSQAAIEPAPPGERVPLLDETDWAALKAICPPKTSR